MYYLSIYLTKDILISISLTKDILISISLTKDILIAIYLTKDILISIYLCIYYICREQQANLAKEDLSDMVAEHAAKQKNKRKRQEQKVFGKL